MPEVYRIGFRTHRQFRTNVERLALPHRPWQAEVEGLRFARRGWTAHQAARRVQRDLAYARGDVTGYPIDSPAQLRLAWWSATPLRRWWLSKRDARREADEVS